MDGLLTMNGTQILELIGRRGLALPERLLERFDWEAVGGFYDFLTGSNERGGFFSKGDSEKILERHLYECLIFVDYVASTVPVSRETHVCDAGTGPGLPGYLFACMKVAPRLTLVDSSRRRLSLLQDYHGPRNRDVQFRFERLEELAAVFDVIVLRALVPFPYSLELVTGLQKIGGHVFLSLGQPPAPTDLSHLGYVSRETYSPPELAFLGARTFLHVSKTKKQDSVYPRPWKTIQEEIRSCRESTP